MSYSRFVNTFKDVSDITGCGSSLIYNVYTKEGQPAKLAQIHNSIDGELPASSFTIVNEPTGVIVEK